MNSAGDDLRISNVVDLRKNFPRDNYVGLHFVVYYGAKSKSLTVK